MIEVKLNYMNWKMQVNNKTLKHFSYVDSSVYHIIAIDGPVYYRCKLNDSEVSDYETNYLGVCNQRIGDAVTLNPLAENYGHIFDGNGFSANCIAGQTTDIEFVVLVESDMSGIEVLNADVGDIVDMKVKDNANGNYSLASTGTAVPNMVLRQFGTNWYVRPSVFVKQLPYAARVMPTMVISFAFKNNGAIDKEIYINLDLHQII